MIPVATFVKFMRGFIGWQTIYIKESSVLSRLYGGDNYDTDDLGSAGIGSVQK